MPTSDPLYLHPEVLSTYRVRDLKSLLQRRYNYKVSDLDHLFYKSDLVNAIVREEGLLGATTAGGSGNWMERVVEYTTYNADGVYVTLAVLVLTVLITFTPLCRYVATSLRLWMDSLALVFNNTWNEGSYLGFTLLPIIITVDLSSAWLRGTILLGWVTPRRYAVSINPYLFPTPNLSFDAASIVNGANPRGREGGFGEGVGGALGFNVAPMLLGWIFGWFRGRLEGWIGWDVKRCREKRRRREKEERRKGGKGPGWGPGGTGEEEEGGKNKRRPRKVYEDDLD